MRPRAARARGARRDAATRSHCPGVEGDNLAARRAARVPRAHRLERGAGADRDRQADPGRRRHGRRLGRRRRGAAAAPPAPRRCATTRLLREIAATLGADVPAQVRPRRYLATGAGEVLHALPDPAPFGILVVRSRAPAVHADVFREADRLGLPRIGRRARGAQRRPRRRARRRRAARARRPAAQRPRAGGGLAAARAGLDARRRARRGRRPRDGLRLGPDRRRAVRRRRAGALGGRLAQRPRPAARRRRAVVPGRCDPEILGEDLAVRRRGSCSLVLLCAGAAISSRRCSSAASLIAIVLCVYGSGVVQLPNLEQVLLDIGQALGAWTYLLVGGARVPGDRGVRRPDRPRRDGDDARRRRRRAGRDQRHHADRRSPGRRPSPATARATCSDGGSAATSSSGTARGSRSRPTASSRSRRSSPTTAARRSSSAASSASSARSRRSWRARAGCRSGASCPYDVLGAGLWATTFIMIGYVFWQSFDRVLKIAKEGALGLGIAITLVVGDRLARPLAARRRRTACVARAARSTAALDRPGLRVLRPVVRWAQGPLRFFIGAAHARPARPRADDAAGDRAPSARSRSSATGSCSSRADAARSTGPSTDFAAATSTTRRRSTIAKVLTRLRGAVAHGDALRAS